MSENQPANMPPYDPRDARAQAKAAKAYEKARRPWYKKKRFILPLALIVLIIIISIATSGGGGGNDTTGTTNTDPTSEPTVTESQPPAFPGAQESDVVGQAGETLTLGDIAVTSTPLIAGDAAFGGSVLCTTATVQNNSSETIDFSTFDWKLQAPSGTINNTTITGSQNLLSTGQVAPGGTATGDICFDNEPAEAGQSVVLYEPIFDFFSDRGAWINTQ
ncbi:DUF4352 domain-containing protein [Arthrobacter citreus]|uniref:DUF4352 domain-containing protein n=1 Tax=Arthrobacter citreus TaxID=1670 RepID=A0ABZ2ZUN8_9MICC